MDMNNSAPWMRERIHVREKYLHDDRRMSFKGLNDSYRRNALIPFLKAADHIRGLSIVFAIDKRVRNFGGFEGLQEWLTREEIIGAKWKTDSFNRMVTVTHVISVLLGLITKKGQNVTWISDADETFATESHRQDCAKLMGRFSSLYVHHGMGQLAIGTTELDEGDRLEEDLAAIPDLSAGAISELLTSVRNELGNIPGIPYLGPRKVSRKTEVITDWLFTPNSWHPKITCVAHHVDGGKQQIGLFWLEDDRSRSLVIPK
jgi:hypothetical protein